MTADAWDEPEESLAAARDEGRLAERADARERWQETLVVSLMLVVTLVLGGVFGSLPGLVLALVVTALGWDRGAQLLPLVTSAIGGIALSAYCGREAVPQLVRDWQTALRHE